MTNEEALKRFKWKYNLTKDYNDPHWEGGERREHSEWVEQLEIAINALEKQIPKKLLNPCGRYFGKAKGGNCPCCGAHTNSITNNYCRKCGQKLLWE